MQLECARAMAGRPLSRANSLRSPALLNRSQKQLCIMFSVGSVGSAAPSALGPGGLSQKARIQLADCQDLILDRIVETPGKEETA